MPFYALSTAKGIVIVMINRDFAQGFVAKIGKQLGYRVNVFDEKAVIIASSDDLRVGNFHQVVYNMITSHTVQQVVRVVSNDMIGVQCGVNLLVTDHHNPIGAIGITGNPDELLDVAKVIKMAFDTMFEYELNHQRMIEEKSRGGAFVYALLFENPQSMTHVRRLAKQFSYVEDDARVPIVLNCPLVKSYEKQLVKDYYASGANSQDIVFLRDDTTFVFFKALDNKEIGYYKNITTTCCNQIKTLITPYLPQDSNIRFYCGIPQLTFDGYRKIFECVEWLQRHKKASIKEEYYFSDYLLEYLQESFPKELIDALLSCYSKIINEKIGSGAFIETVSSLVESNMHENEAAARIYMHKNTVIGHLKKIKDSLSINPINNTKDCILLILLLNYLEYYG